MDGVTTLLKVKVFADGAERDSMLELSEHPLVSGFTTNPTLMKQAGVSNYQEFALDVLSLVDDQPISFSVFADNLTEMEEHAQEISSWGENIYVKIPITNTKGESTAAIVERLSESGVKVNVTAVMTMDQVRDVVPALRNSQAAIISLFAGRIADTGRDPLPIMREAVRYLQAYSQIELLWASPREVLNIVQADQIGCDIITVTPSLLNKVALFGKDLTEFSLETVKMFHDDSSAAGLALKPDYTPSGSAVRPRLEV